MQPSDLKFAVLSISSSRTDKSQDVSGNLLIKEIEDYGAQVISYFLIRDDQQLIEDTLMNLINTNSTSNSLNNKKPDIILSTGGTGCTIDDVTPEATLNVITQRLNSVETALTNFSLTKTPFSMLSRLVAGIRRPENVLIINFPGSKKAVVECFSVVRPIFCHLVDQMKNIRKTSCEAGRKLVGNGNEITKDKNTEQKNKKNEKFDCNCFINESLVPDEKGIIKSKYPMIPLQEAIKICQKEITELKLKKQDSGLIQIPVSSMIEYLPNADNKTPFIIAEDILAPVDIPILNTSRFDGYAIKCPENSTNSKNTSRCYQISQTNQPAFAGQEPIKKFTENTATHCIKINTGGIIPDQFDTIIMLEQTKLSVDKKSIAILESFWPVKKYFGVRFQGSDIRKHEILVEKGAKVDNKMLAFLLQSQYHGLVKIKAMERLEEQLKFGVLSSGNEIMDIRELKSQIPTGWQIDSNRPYIINQLKSDNPSYNVLDLGIIPDDALKFQETVESIFNGQNGNDQLCDILITSGAVSMGEKDIIKACLEKWQRNSKNCNFETQILFGRVNVKPGKPMTLSKIIHKTTKKTSLIFSLPGNPVSAIMCFEIFVRNLLKKDQLHGSFAEETPYQLDIRPEFVRIKILDQESQNNQKDQIKFITTGSQASSRLRSLAESKGVAIFPGKTDEKSCVETGDVVKIILF